jgi:hypothetical protein
MVAVVEEVEEEDSRVEEEGDGEGGGGKNVSLALSLLVFFALLLFVGSPPVVEADVIMVQPLCS